MRPFLLALALLFSCSGDPVPTFTDPRDGKTYRIVTIGEQVWMAENLNYNVKGSSCYGEDRVPDIDEHGNIKYIATTSSEIQANCKKYGRLYDWETALKVCPKGWHLPDTTEWNVLVDFAGGEEVAGKKLKAKKGWNDAELLSGNISGNGEDKYGFSALPGGYGADYDFYNVGNNGSWWSATEGNTYNTLQRDMLYNQKLVLLSLQVDKAFHWNMHNNNENMNWNYNDKILLFSVRCVRD